MTDHILEVSPQVVEQVPPGKDDASASNRGRRGALQVAEFSVQVAASLVDRILRVLEVVEETTALRAVFAVAVRGAALPLLRGVQATTHRVCGPSEIS